MNLYELFAIAGARAPRQVALRMPAAAESPAVEWSYGELLARAEALAAALQAWGLAPGERVACWLANRPEMIVLHLALLRAGGVLVPLNLAYRPREAGAILADSTPCLLVAEEAQRELLAAVPAAQRASLAAVLGPHAVAEALAAAPPRRLPLPAPPAGAAAVPALAEVPAAAAVPARAAGGGDEVAMLLYTSGTTGPSKGAMLTHNNLLATVTGLLAAWDWRAADVLPLALPLFHVHGLIVGLDCALAAGATVELRRRFDAAAVAAELEAGGATLFFGVPTLYVRLVAELRRRRDAGEAGGGIAGLRLCCSGSAPLAAETFAAFAELTGQRILERYGMTETGMLLGNPYLGPRVAGEVGGPFPGVSARVADEAGRDLPPGEAGELVVRGANVFAGYWQAPEKTAASFVHDASGRRWFRTGDLARQDPATGAYTLLGRRHELILSGGFNVYPREVEETLLGFPGVGEAAVVGRPHPDWGEAPVAFVVTTAPLDPAALLAWCRSQLAGFKVPHAVHQVESLPRNALGKLQKHLLP